MVNADTAAAVPRDLIIRSERTIGRTESLLPRIVGANKSEIDPYVKAHHAVEDLPRAFDGPFPTGDIHFRTRLIALALRSSPEEVGDLVEKTERRFRLGSFHIFTDDQVLFEQIARNALGRDLAEGETQYVLTPSDPFISLLEGVADTTRADSAAKVITSRRESKDLTGNLFDDATNVAKYKVDITHESDSAGFFTHRASPPAGDLLRPQLAVWILKKSGGVYKDEVIGGGASAQEKTVDRLGDFAARVTQTTLVLRDSMDRKVEAHGSPAESTAVLQAYATKTWEGLKPQLRRLLLTQGFDPATYNPLDWSYADPASGKVVTIREMIKDIETRLGQISNPADRHYVEEFLGWVRDADKRLTEYLSGSSIEPSQAELQEPRTSTALAVIAATNAIVVSGGAVVKVELPLSKIAFIPHAAETVFGKFRANPDYDVFTRDVWTELLYRKDGTFNESEWNRLRLLARGLLKDIGVNVEGEFKETDQEVMFQTTRSMLDPFDADPPPVRKRKEKYATALDMAWSVWMSDLAAEKEASSS